MHGLRLRRHPESVVGGARTAAASAWWWLAGGTVLFFLVPYVGTDLLGLQPDLYYLVYFTVAVVWFVAFVEAYATELRDLWGHGLGPSLAVGTLAGAALVAMVLSQEGTDHPDGWQFWFEIVWRGVVYGSIDALTLFVFPAAVAYLVMHRRREGAGRRVGYAALTLSLSLLVSTSYHLGYAEFRDADLRSPLIGTVVANVPAMTTGNPLGAVVTHSMVHTAAVVHQRDGGATRMLPPRVDAAYPSRGDSDVAAGLAALWLLITGGVLGLVARRRRTC